MTKKVANPYILIAKWLNLKMLKAVIDDQYTAARTYFASVFGVFLVESACRLSQNLHLKYTSSHKARGNGTHWRLTVLCHKLLSYHITIPFVLDHHVADLVRFLVFLALNIIFGINDNEFTTDYKLYGWLTIANGGLALLLAPRENLLSLVLRIPSNVLLQYHRWIGMATVAHGTAHFAFNIMHYAQTDQIESSFANTRIRIGTMAWLCLAIILLTALPIVRRRGFEIFYYAHFLFFVFMVGALIHTTNGPEFLLPGFSLWVVDRIIRLYHSFRSIEIKDIAHYEGQVSKFTIKGIKVSRPGQVVWVQLPGVSFWNWHPFTAVSPPRDDDDTTTFAIRGLGAYTNAVQYVDTDRCNERQPSMGETHQSACRGVKLRLNGPYGVGRLDWHSFPVVVLVAGGIGITPAVGIISSIVSARHSLNGRRVTVPAGTVDIHLVWVVKSIQHSNWFKDELQTLHDLTSRPGSTVRLSISLHHTETGNTQAMGQQEEASSAEKVESMPTCWNIILGRPNFDHKFREVTEQHAGCDVGVNLCGPREMIRLARNAAVGVSSTASLFHIEDEIFERYTRQTLSWLINESLLLLLATYVGDGSQNIRQIQAGPTQLRTLAGKTNARENQIFKLPDGRILGFAEFGTADGKPLLYFHGYPSCRLEPKQIEKLAERQDIRLIAIDRPGFGLSSPQPGRCMLDWARDVEQFAKGIGLDRFAIMGLFGGGPYALATAYALPRTMLSSVGLFASGPNWAAGRNHMTWFRRLASLMAVYWPGGLAMVLNATVASVRWVLRREWVKRMLGRKLKALEDSEKPVAESEKRPTRRAHGFDHSHDEPKSPGQVDELVRTLLSEPFAQGATAAVEEAKILSDPDWGFRLEDVTYPNIKIWHGVRDRNPPIVMMRYLAEKVPNCTLYESDDTHYSMGHGIEAALKELAGGPKDYS